MSNSSERLQAIETVMLKMLETNPPTFEIRNWRREKNLQFTDRLAIIWSSSFRILRVLTISSIDQCVVRLSLQSAEKSDVSYIRFNYARSRQLFTCVVHLMVKIYKMIKMNVWCTKREIYYQEINIMSDSQMVNYSLMIICYLLNYPPWELNIMSSTKGLVAGPLLLKTDNNEIIDFSSPGGSLIPHKISSGKTELKSSAKYVLLVEKDAIFQKLLSDNILHKLEDLLLITGKGYPDVYTRILVKKLNRQLQLPILALFDSDPDGIAIMCVYRFGSEALSRFVDKLATPEIKWLGIHPTDIEQFSVTTLPLGERDARKLRNLTKKPFVLANTRILDQVNAMLQSAQKAEIEALDEIAPNFLIDKYICSKILNNQLY